MPEGNENFTGLTLGALPAVVPKVGVTGQVSQKRELEAAWKALARTPNQVPVAPSPPLAQMPQLGANKEQAEQIHQSEGYDGKEVHSN